MPKGQMAKCKMEKLYGETFLDFRNFRNRYDKINLKKFTKFMLEHEIGELIIINRILFYPKT